MNSLQRKSEHRFWSEGNNRDGQPFINFRVNPTHTKAISQFYFTSSIALKEYESNTILEFSSWMNSVVWVVSSSSSSDNARFSSWHPQSFSSFSWLCILVKLKTLEVYRKFNLSFVSSLSTCFHLQKVQSFPWSC